MSPMSEGASKLKGPKQDSQNRLMSPMSEGASKLLPPSDIDDIRRFWLSCLGPLAYFLPKGPKQDSQNRLMSPMSEGARKIKGLSRTAKIV
jgi:hypothetical protein